MDKDLPKKFCKLPWTFMTIGDRKCHSCCWQLIKHVPTGDTGSMDLLKEWNSPMIQALRKGVLNGTYSMCNKQTCFHIQDCSLPTKEEVLKEPHWKYIIENNVIEMVSIPDHVHFEADESCNLECPMCRDGKIDGSNIDHAFGEALLWDTFEKAKNDDKYVIISMCGTGEPFYSKACRNFLFNVDLRPYPKIKLGFNTNGLLLTPKTWELMDKANKNIRYLNWSIEGSSKEVYETCRKGGNFEQLVKNLDFIYTKKDQIESIILCYVVHKDSYKDMANFVKWNKERWNFDISFQRVQTNTLSRGPDLDVFNETHPLHLDLLEELKNPVLRSERVFLSSVTPFMPK